VLLATTFGLVLSKEAMIYSYIFTFALLAAVMTNTCQYFYMHLPEKQDCWGRFAPSALLTVATVLLLVAPLKNLVVNVCMASFRQNGFDSTIESALDLAYLPVFSTRLVQLYTSFAYALMLWATAMQVDLGAKLKGSLQAKAERKRPS